MRSRLIAGRLQPVDAILERGIIEIGDPAFDRIVEPLQAQFSLGGALVQLWDMLATPVGSFLPTIQDLGQHVLKPVRNAG